MRDKNETVEGYWSQELHEVVQVREFPEWGEYDLYLNSHFAQTFVSIEALEQYLGYYYLKRDYGMGQVG